MLREIERRLLNLCAPVMRHCAWLRRCFLPSVFKRAVPGEKPIKVVLVCKGNICRSCYAEVKLRSLADLRGMSVDVTSGGLWTTAGKSADVHAINAAQLKRIDLTQHRTKSADVELLQQADLIFGMEPWHVRAAKALVPEKRAHIGLLGALGVTHETDLVIGDPFGGSPAEFAMCFAQIDVCLEGLLRVLKGSGH